MPQLNIFSKINKLFNLKVAAAGLVAVAAIFVYIVWSVQPATDVKVYLPEDINAYIEWSDSEYFDSTKLFEWGILDQGELVKYVEQVSMALGEKFYDQNQLVIFGAGSSADNDNILMSFDRLSKKDIEMIAANLTDYSLKQLDKHTLFATRSGLEMEIEDSAAETDEKIDTGINIYWHNGYRPSYIKLSDQFFSEQSLSPEIFIRYSSGNSSKEHILTVSGVTNDNFTLESDNISQALIPARVTQATVWQSADIQALSNIVGHLLSGVYTAMPQVDFVDAALLQVGDDWLLIGNADWKSYARSLSSSFKLDEKEKVLPDGTKYTELVAAEQIDVGEREFGGHSYWQLDNYFGSQWQNYYYLSNSSSVIEDVFISDAPLGDKISSCLENDEQALDWFAWQTREVTDNSVRDIVARYGDRSVIGINYISEGERGFRFCAQD